MSLDANTPSSSRFSVNSSIQSGKSRNQFPGAGTMSLFLCVFLVFVGLRDRFLDAGTLVSSLRSVAGLHEESSDVSCGHDVADVLALELEKPVADPGTTVGTKFSVMHRIILSFWVTCGSWPLVHSYECPCSSQSLPNDRTAGVSSRI